MILPLRAPIWGLMDLMWETWEQTPFHTEGLPQYVFKFQEYLAQAGVLTN